jgi:uncharacterized protein (TIGR02145 family)
MAKNKAWIQYTKQGQIVPGSLIVSPRRPKNGVWYEVITDICCDIEPPFGVISSRQKAFVKYDASGNIVPGTLILTDSRLPRPGIWKEVYIDICCAEPVPAPRPSVTICDQTWSLYNLDVTTYRNGDPIPEVSDPTAWANLTTGAWCYYANNSGNGVVYGKLYNWYAVNDPRGLAPFGWHIPTDAEWDTLITNCLGGDTSIVGGAIKEAGTVNWAAPNSGATNSTGFTALPAGKRLFIGTIFTFLTTSTYFWSSTQSSPTNAWSRWVWNTSGAIFRNNWRKTEGLSVRMIKD